MLSDCHLSYKPTGSGVPLDSLHYVLPRCLPTLYPSELVALSTTATLLQALVEDNTSTVTPSAPPPPPSASPIDMLTLATCLRDLSDKVLRSNAPSATTAPPKRDSNGRAIPNSNQQTHSNSNEHTAPTSLTLVSTMSCNKVLKHIHHAGSPPSAVCP
jgi:hypothetical protein